MAIRSEKERFGWAQFDALQLGSGWDEEDIGKPQILVEDAYGDSHPGSVHLAGLSTQAVYGVYEKGGHPAQFHVTDICDGCAQGHGRDESGAGVKGSDRRYDRDACRVCALGRDAAFLFL